MANLVSKALGGIPANQDQFDAEGLLNADGRLLNFLFDNAGALKVSAVFSGTIGMVDQGGAGTESWPVVEDNSASILAALNQFQFNGSGELKVAASVSIGSVDVTDRAGRLLGIVYGNLDKLQQKSSTLELLVWDNNLATVFGTASLLSSGRLKTEATQSGAWSVSVSNFPSTYDVSDRAARLLGIVYGSLDQLQQKASTKELLTWDDNLATVFGSASLISSGRLKVDGSGVTQPISGTVIASQGTSPWVSSVSNFPSTWDISDRAGRLLGIVYGSLDQLQQKATTLELLTWDDNLSTVFGTVSLIASGRVKVDGSGVTQPVSGTVTANQGTSPWVVSGSVTVSNFPSTVDVSDRAGRLLGIVYGSLDKLQQRASTLELFTWDSNLATVLGTASLIASGRVKVDGSGVTQPISAASLPLPSGAATAANQATEISSLSSIDGKLSGTLTASISGSVGTTLDGINANQTTSNTSAVQLTASSVPAINGIMVGALSTNTASVFVAGSGVTSGNGVEILPGGSQPFTATNINLLYVIGSNGTDKVWWNVL